MIRSIQIESFKSIEKMSVELGQINVFIGANGSGKSNFLEAIGVLSAAADGKVNDQVLLQRGVRPGLPSLYKTSFKDGVRQKLPHLFLAAESEVSGTKYEVTLHNPLASPQPSWRFKTELWQEQHQKLAGRSPSSKKEKLNSEFGIAALKAVEMNQEEHPSGIDLLQRLRSYVIYTPTTSVLRGTTPETQPRFPIGLSGGNLPGALLSFLTSRRQDNDQGAHSQKVAKDALGLIDWAKSYSSAPASSLPLSASASSSPQVVRFVDRYMHASRNTLSGYDASEGALFVLFLAILSGHPDSPSFCAVDNADHGLNPRLAQSLMRNMCNWYLTSPIPRQILMTTHNPLVLDGLKLQDDRVRLFTVSRTEMGRTLISRVSVTDRLLGMAKDGWTLSRLWVMGHLGGVPDV